MTCREELEEVMKLVKPQHFLPVHGEYAFLKAHAQLARDIGVHNTSVIRNGQMLGVQHQRNGRVVSTTGASLKSMQMLGETKLRLLYNDGNKVSHAMLLCGIRQLLWRTAIPEVQEHEALGRSVLTPSRASRADETASAMQQLGK